MTHSFEQPGSQSRSVKINASNPIAQVFALIILVALIIIGITLGILLLIPIAILGIILFVYFKIKRAFSRAKDPNGPLDGRHNVRVINRDE